VNNCCAEGPWFKPSPGRNKLCYIMLIIEINKLINNLSALLQSVLEGKLFYSSVPGQVSIRTMEDICDTVG
jgi:hypothetical protein